MLGMAVNAAEKILGDLLLVAAATCAFILSASSFLDCCALEVGFGCPRFLVANFIAFA